jgi:hypothetical protein
VLFAGFDPDAFAGSYIGTHAFYFKCGAAV